MRGIAFDPIASAPLVMLLAIVLALTTARLYLITGKTLGWLRNLLLLLFRLAGISLLALMLLQPSRVEKIPPPGKERITLVGE